MSDAIYSPLISLWWPEGGVLLAFDIQCWLDCSRQQQTRWAYWSAAAVQILEVFVALRAQK